MGIGRMQMYVVAKPTIEAKNIKDLVALAKSQPGKLNYASSGTATPPHLAGELFKQSTGVFITHVPYRGSAPGLQDVMAGQADFVFDPGIAFPHIKAGKVKLLGVASDRKSPFFPDAPTYADLGSRTRAWTSGSASGRRTTAGRSRRAAVARVDQGPGLARRSSSASTASAPSRRRWTQPAFRKLLAEEDKMLSALIKDRKIVVE